MHRDFLGWDVVHRDLLEFFQALAEEALEEEEDELEAFQIEVERQEAVIEELALEYAIEHDVPIHCATWHRFTMLCGCYEG